MTTFLQVGRLLKTTKNRGALIVAEVLSGNSEHISNGTTINIDGMNRSQFNALVTSLAEIINSKQGDIKITLRNKPN